MFFDLLNISHTDLDIERKTILMILDVQIGIFFKRLMNMQLLVLFVDSIHCVSRIRISLLANNCSNTTPIKSFEVRLFKKHS